MFKTKKMASSAKIANFSTPEFKRAKRIEKENIFVLKENDIIIEKQRGMEDYFGDIDENYFNDEDLSPINQINNEDDRNPLSEMNSICYEENETAKILEKSQVERTLNDYFNDGTKLTKNYTYHKKIKLHQLTSNELNSLSIKNSNNNYPDTLVVKVRKNRRHIGISKISHLLLSTETLQILKFENPFLICKSSKKMSKIHYLEDIISAQYLSPCRLEITIKLTLQKVKKTIFIFNNEIQAKIWQQNILFYRFKYMRNKFAKQEEINVILLVIILFNFYLEP
jgi:hypothetical protein